MTAPGRVAETTRSEGGCPDANAGQMLFAAILISAFGGLVMFAARTGPLEATSNISKWMAWMGAPTPQWLSTPTADNWAKRFAILLLVIGSIVFCAWVYGQAQTQSLPRISAPNNQGIVTNGQRGDNYINKDPRSWGFTEPQWNAFKSALPQSQTPHQI